MGFEPLVLDMYHGDVVNSWEAIWDAGIRGIIHKASQGASFRDKKYQMRRQPILDQGFLLGYYHFGTGEDVDQQVDNFLGAVGDTNNVLLALDFEPNPKGSTMSLAQAISWLQKVYEKTGQRPVIYSGHLIKEALNKSSTYNDTLKEHRLWLAQYGSTAKVPLPWDNYWIWQYTGDGIGQKPHQVTGFQGDADLNIFDGTFEELKAQWAIPSATESKDEEEVAVENEHSEDTWMNVAKNLIGTDEVPGSKNNPIIIQWAKDLGLIKDYNADSIPWCGLFTAHVLSEAGHDVVDTPLWALSWKNYGEKLDEPLYGAILVFKRTGGGHVGFCVGQEDNYYHVLGGNQDDTVSIKKIEKSRCVGIRWPDGVPKSYEVPYQALNVSVSTNEA